MANWKRAITGSLAEIYALKMMNGVRPGFRVLLYHSVGTRLAQDTYGMSITPELFGRQMEMLAESSWLKLTSFANPGPTNDVLQVAVTFDDGYKDNLYRAAPVLVKYKIPFTVFVATDFIESGAEFLTRSELRELASLPGATIGSHGATHLPLVQADDATLRRELNDSRRKLEDLLGEEIKAVAYPHGSVNKRVRHAARQAGYERGGCSRFGINDERSDPLLLSRCEVWATDNERVFRQKLAGAWDWYRWRRRDPTKK